MDWHLYVLSAHPLAATVLVRSLAADQELRRWLYPTPYSNPRSVPQDPSACLFLLDTSSIRDDISSTCKFLRLRCPGCKLLALLPPDQSAEEQMLRLLYTGVDGFVSLTDNVEEELPRAVHSILDGNLWVPPQVIRKFIKQANLLLDEQLRPDLPLTARENQVFQLIVRRLSNKEIAAALKFSERTAKFHVSNILAKLKVNSRAVLLESAGCAPNALLSAHPASSGR